MNALETEYHRLYCAPEGLVRALVLELARPADWDLLSPLWRGVQTDLALPAPAIAVSGLDGYQLWFSLAEPVPMDEAAAFLDALWRHYLGGLAPSRIRTIPSLADDPLQPQPLPQIPCQQPGTSQWSAYVAPDLAPIFAQEPWLFQEPSPGAQASVLARLTSIKPAAFSAALSQLRPAALTGRPAPAPAPASAPAPTPASAARYQEPRSFLLDVMNDPSIELRLRIEAAKALLPYVER